MCIRLTAMIANIGTTKPKIVPFCIDNQQLKSIIILLTDTECQKYWYDKQWEIIDSLQECSTGILHSVVFEPYANCDDHYW
jgi:hypothetical protein